MTESKAEAKKYRQAPDHVISREDWVAKRDALIERGFEFHDANVFMADTVGLCPSPPFPTIEAHETEGRWSSTSSLWTNGAKVELINGAGFDMNADQLEYVAERLQAQADWIRAWGRHGRCTPTLPTDGDKSESSPLVYKAPKTRFKILSYFQKD